MVGAVAVHTQAGTFHRTWKELRRDPAHHQITYPHEGLTVIIDSSGGPYKSLVISCRDTTLKHNRLALHTLSGEADLPDPVRNNFSEFFEWISSQEVDCRSLRGCGPGTGRGGPEESCPLDSTLSSWK